MFDLSGFSLKNMDWGVLIQIIQILEGYYPETLFKLYIHRAPWMCVATDQFPGYLEDYLGYA